METETQEVQEVARKLATVQKISALDPIEGADKIECATVMGWKMVVKKGEFKVGDLVVYVEIDSWVPYDIAPFLSKGKEPREYKGVKGERLKTIRLRGQVSQGLVLSLDDLLLTGVEVGQDLTAMLGIQKWEPFIPANLRGTVKGNFPSFLIKTDSHRIQAYPDLLDEMAGINCYGSIKLDGTSSTFYNVVEDGEDKFGVCSRNLDLKRSDDNTYWQMSDKYELDKKLSGKNVAVQAETFGPGIQKNKMGASELQIGVFDVFDIEKGCYFDYASLCHFCSCHDLPMVKIVHVGEFYWRSIEDLIDYANRQRYNNNTISEGVVFRPLVERYSKVLKGRMAFKIISPEFLIKYGG